MHRRCPPLSHWLDMSETCGIHLAKSVRVTCKTIRERGALKGIRTVVQTPCVQFVQTKSYSSLSRSVSKNVSCSGMLLVETLTLLASCLYRMLKRMGVCPALKSHEDSRERARCTAMWPRRGLLPQTCLDDGGDPLLCHCCILRHS